jgi:hypothetical protein
MNKKNQGIEVKLSVVAISAILVASLFVMGSSRFIPDAMAQNFTDLGAAAGGAANQTGAAAGGVANQTGAAAGGGATNATGAAAGGGVANQTGAAAGGVANQTGAAAAGGATNATGAMVMIPQAAMTTMMDDITTIRGAIDEGDTEAVDALDNVEMQLRTAAGLPLEETAADEEEAGAEEEEAGAEEEEAGAEEEEAGAEEEEAGAEEEGAAADEDEDEGA